MIYDFIDSYQRCSVFVGQTCEEIIEADFNGFVFIVILAENWFLTSENSSSSAHAINSVIDEPTF